MHPTVNLEDEVKDNMGKLKIKLSVGTKVIPISMVLMLVGTCHSITSDIYLLTCDFVVSRQWQSLTVHIFSPHVIGVIRTIISIL